MTQIGSEATATTIVVIIAVMAAIGSIAWQVVRAWRKRR